MRVFSLYRSFVQVALAMCVSVVSSNTVAAQEVEPLFTPEEQYIINRQKEVIEARGGSPYDYRPFYGPSFSTLQKGGSGSNRWAVYLYTERKYSNRYGSDNRYAIDTRQTKALGKARSYLPSSITGRHFTVYRAQVVIQTLFVSPADRGGVAKRNVTLELECPYPWDDSSYPRADRHRDISHRRLRYEDFDSSGNLINTQNFNERIMRYPIGDRRNSSSLFLTACDATYTYPQFVKLLLQGQNPTGNQNPSYFD